MKDKLLHLIAGTGLFLILLLFISPKASIITVVILAFLKEVNDRKRYIPQLLTSNNKKGMFDYWDLVASVIVPLIIVSFL